MNKTEQQAAEQWE